MKKISGILILLFLLSLFNPVFALSKLASKSSPEKPASSKASTTEEPMDISGTWVEMKGDKPGREWEIKTDKTGKITLIMPSRRAPSKLLEYSGSIKGNIITAVYIVKEPAVMNPKLPLKVREILIKNKITWILNLKVSETGDTIEGTHDPKRIYYSTKTLKIKKVEPLLVKYILKKKVNCADIQLQLYKAVQNFYNALAQKDRSLMIKAKQMVEVLQSSLKSQKLLPKGCEHITRFIPQVLKRMEAYINPPKSALVKGPTGEGMLPPDTAIISAETHPTPSTPQEQINWLAINLVSNWEASSNQQASDAVYEEARLIAGRIIRHIYQRYNVNGWRGGWDRNFIVGIRETAEDFGIDSLASRLQYYGKCYEWANTLNDTFNNIGRLQYFSGAHIWQPGDPETGVGTHHAFAIYKRGASYEEGIVIDPWRNDGLPFWCPVNEDHYNWLNFPSRQ